MFENLKAFKAGWSNQGKIPSVPAALSRRYLEAAADFLERKIEMKMALNIVAKQASEVGPTVLTYMNMPFVIAGVWASYSFGDRSAEHSAILEALLNLAGANYSNAPDIAIGEAFILEAEREDMLRYFREQGSTGTREKIFQDKVSRSIVSQYMVKNRSSALATLIPECVAENQWTESGLRHFVNLAGHYFTACSTFDVTENKRRAFEAATLTLMRIYMQKLV